VGKRPPATEQLVDVALLFQPLAFMEGKLLDKAGFV
jgi:hypothetical protein